MECEGHPRNCTKCWNHDSIYDSLLGYFQNPSKRIHYYHWDKDITNKFIAKVRPGLFGTDPNELYSLVHYPWDKNKKVCKINCRKGYYWDSESKFEPDKWYMQYCYRCSDNCKSCEFKPYNCTECWNEQDITNNEILFASRKNYPAEQITDREKSKPFAKVSIVNYMFSKSPIVKTEQCKRYAWVENEGSDKFIYNACKLNCKVGYSVYINDEISDLFSHEYMLK